MVLRIICLLSLAKVGLNKSSLVAQLKFTILAVPFNLQNPENWILWFLSCLGQYAPNFVVASVKLDVLIP